MAIAVAALFALHIRAFAAEGDLDATFTPPALTTGVYDVLTEDDGSLIAVGHFTAPAAATARGIVKLTANGSVDTAFAPLLSGASELPVATILRQADGKYLVCGAFSQMHGVARNSIARLNADGTLDTSFDPGVGPNRAGGSRIAHDMVLQPDGKILVGGQFSTWNGVARRGLVRLNADGTLDESLGNFGAVVTFFGSGEMVKSVSLQSSSSLPHFKILVGGIFYKAWSGANHGGVIRLNADGTFDTTFAMGSGSMSGLSLAQVSAVAALPNDKILVSGKFGAFSGVAAHSFLRLNADGTRDAIYSANVEPGITGGLADAFRMQPLPDGRVLVAGFFTQADGAAAPGLARFNADGTRDTGFGAATTAAWGLTGIRVQKDGHAIACMYDSTDTTKMLRRLTNTIVSPGVVQFANASAVVVEGNEVILTVERVGGGAGELAVLYGTVDRTAELPFDLATTSGVLKWADGDTAAKTISINVPLDGTVENDEVFDVNLAPIGVTRLGLQARSTVTIQNADVAGGQPIVIFRTAAQTVMEDTASVVAIHVDLSAAAAGQVTVPFTITGSASGPATIPKDYTVSPASPLVFAPGDREKLITVTLTNDTMPEGDETIFFRAPNATGAVLDGTRNTHTITISDNEAKPVFTAQPQHVLAFVGQSSADFTAAATGLPAPTLQWLKNGKVLPSLVGPGISVGNVTLLSAATFSVKASNKVGTTTYSTTSATAELDVVDNTGKTFVLAAGPASNASLTVPTAGKLLSFEWRNAMGMPLPASNRILNVGTKTLTIKGLATADTGKYICHVEGPDPAQSVDVTYDLKVVTEKPVITVAAINLGTVVVGEPITPTAIPVDENNTVTDDRAVASFRAAGLPKGLILNPITGVLSGQPTVAKPTGYSFKVYAKNAKGETTGVPVTLIVNAFPQKIAGAYIGHVADHAVLNPRGGRVEFSVTTNSSVSGKLILGPASLPFTSLIQTSTAAPTLCSAEIRIPNSTLTLSFSCDAATGLLSNAKVSDGATDLTVTGWRNVWSSAVAVKPYAGYYTLALQPPPTQANPTPEGCGYAYFTVAPTGTLTVDGVLADGTTFKTPGFVGPTGQVLVYQMLYGGKGSVHGLLDIAEGTAPAFTDSLLAGAAKWTRDTVSPSAIDRTYTAGFTNASLVAEGGRYVAVPATSIVLGLQDMDDNAQLDFSGGGLESNATDPNPDYTFRIKKGGGVTYPVPNSNTVKITVTPSTGVFKGSFTLSQMNGNFLPPKTEKRSAPFAGIVIQQQTNQGMGHFLLPELSTPAVPATLTKKLSGKVILETSK